MDSINKFFQKVSSSPSLIWSGSAAFIFISLGLAIIFVPSLSGGQLSGQTQWGLAGLMIVYGLFRLYTFYSEYKKTGDV